MYPDPLLTGTAQVLASAIGEYSHHSLGGILRSAKIAHLCSFLILSAKSDSDVFASIASTAQHGSISTRIREIGENLVLEAYREQKLGSESTLHIQHSKLRGAKLLKVQRVHRCRFS
jgi:hypothetical protein